MAVYHGIDAYTPTEYGAHVALGYFDGVHMGHRAVIAACADSKGRCDSLVLTFSQSPAAALGRPQPSILTDNATKAALIGEMGIDGVIFADFNAVRDYSAENFVRVILRDRLHAKKVCCGYNYRFGKDGRGDTILLRRLCAAYGIGVEVHEPVSIDGTAVSSTEIRRRLSAGDVAGANRMLGYPYRICGTVVGGNHIGTEMGYPTVNIPIADGAAVPAYGVYATEIRIDGRVYKGATNIGVHPTVGSNDMPLCETFLLDFEGGDLYGKHAACALLRYIRPESAFRSPQELSEQIQRDIAQIQSGE